VVFGGKISRFASQARIFLNLLRSKKVTGTQTQQMREALKGIVTRDEYVFTLFVALLMKKETQNISLLL
jgi:hypothetical protein